MNASVICFEEEDTEYLSGVPIRKEQAVNDIYNTLDRFFSEDDNKTYFWGNDFIFRNLHTDSITAIRYRLCADASVLSEGNAEFRRKTHIVFQKACFGVLWKILPLSVTSFTKESYDGCFTKNYDGVFDRMALVNQYQVFGSAIHVFVKDAKYLLWMGDGGALLPQTPSRGSEAPYKKTD